jgi:predicted ATPase
MLQTVAIRGYRSLREVILPLGRLSIITGANGVGKSSVYRALRLLADCGRGEVIGSLAREGGLQSVLWAGPEQLGAARRSQKTEGTVRSRPVSLEMGFAADDFGYLVDLGMPQSAGPSVFVRDPEIKREVLFAGPVLRPSATLVRRSHSPTGWPSTPSFAGTVSLLNPASRGSVRLSSRDPGHAPLIDLGLLREAADFDSLLAGARHSST